MKNSDTSIILNSVLMFKAQARNAWQDVQKINFQKQSDSIANIVIAGMGGSTLGAHFIISVFEKNIKLPMMIVNDYHLPPWVSKNTLVIVSSYSGNTEETVSAFNEALEKKAMVVAISTGGILQKLSEKNNVPNYLINEQFNPSKQPRYALGYNLFGILGILTKMNLLSLSPEEINQEINQLPETEDEFYTLFPKKEIQLVARSLKNKIPIIVAGEFLVACTHILQNQINESAKNFAVYFTIPEMNHHLLEALTKPNQLAQKINFLFLSSDLYPEKVQKRFKITQQILQKLHIRYNTIVGRGKTSCTQALRMMMLGGILSLELAKLNKKDPAPVPFVEEFKKLINN